MKAIGPEMAAQNGFDPAPHSIVAGDATPGATLTLSRTGATPTWEGSFTDRVDTVLTCPRTARSAGTPTPRPVRS